MCEVLNLHFVDGDIHALIHSEDDVILRNLFRLSTIHTHTAPDPHVCPPTPHPIATRRQCCTLALPRWLECIQEKSVNLTDIDNIAGHGEFLAVTALVSTNHLEMPSLLDSQNKTSLHIKLITL